MAGPRAQEIEVGDNAIVLSSFSGDAIGAGVVLAVSPDRKGLVRWTESEWARFPSPFHKPIEHEEWLEATRLRKAVD